MNTEQRKKYSAKHIRRMKLFERKHLKPIITALVEQITPVVKVLREQGIEAAMNSIDTVQINSHLAKPVTDIYKEVGLYFANKTIFDLRQEQKAGFGFNAEFLRDILNYFARYLLNKAVLPISNDIKNLILKVLSAGLEQGKGAEEIARELVQPELTLWRARMITRTEANKAMNYGQLLGESKSDWESNKIWIAADDHRTRHSHNDMDDVMIDFNDKYLVPIYKSIGGIPGKKKGIQTQVGVDLMTGPGDVNASAGNVINCRCTIGFKLKRDENGRLIRKKETIFVKAKEPEMTKDEISDLLIEFKNGIIADVNNTTIFQRDKIFTKIGEVESKLSSVIENKELKAVVTQPDEQILSAIQMQEAKGMESIDNLISLINSKDYNPEIKLNTTEVKADNSDILKKLEELKKLLSKKREWDFQIKREDNLITGGKFIEK